MKVFLDTNVLIDYLLNREEANNATCILQLGHSGLLELLVSDLSIADIAYITRKDIPTEDFCKTMTVLGRFYTIVPLGQDVVNTALASQWKDFEDCLQFLSAKQANADCIITRNPDDFKDADIPVFTPSQFVEMI